jgi:hypothetical protein
MSADLIGSNIICHFLLLKQPNIEHLTNFGMFCLKKRVGVRCMYALFFVCRPTNIFSLLAQKANAEFLKRRNIWKFILGIPLESCFEGGAPYYPLICRSHSIDGLP